MPAFLKRFIFAISVLAGWFQVATPLQADAVIDLQKGDDLKMLFDGGVRPWHMPGFERSILGFSPGRYEITVSESESFSLPVVQGSVSVVEGNKLVTLELYGQNTTVAEATSGAAILNEGTRASA